MRLVYPSGALEVDFLARRLADEGRLSDPNVVAAQVASSTRGSTHSGVTRSEPLHEREAVLEDERRVVVELAVVQHAAVAVIGVLAQAHIRDHYHLRHVAANRPVAAIVLQNPPPLRQLILGHYGWWNLWLIATPVALGVPSELDSLNIGIFRTFLLKLCACVLI